MKLPLGDTLHQLPAVEVLQLLGTDAEKGLDTLELQSRQAWFGPNLIPAARGQGPWVRFLLQFHTPLVYILLVAAAITAALHEWIDSGVIFGVVLVNAVIGFLQESSAAKALAAMAQTTLTEASVLRAGQMRRSRSRCRLASRGWPVGEPLSGANPVDQHDHVRAPGFDVGV